MTPETKEKRHEQLALMKQMFDAGGLSAPAYYKAVVLIAHDFFLHGNLKEACTLIQMCPGSYFDETAPAQATEDTLFGEIVKTLASALTEAGLVDALPRTVVRITQGMAKA